MKFANMRLNSIQCLHQFVHHKKTKIYKCIAKQFFFQKKLFYFISTSLFEKVQIEIDFN